MVDFFVLCQIGFACNDVAIRKFYRLNNERVLGDFQALFTANKERN